MGRAGACTFYVVRVWIAEEGFHAEVRDVQCERGMDFSDASALASFLAAVPRAAESDAPPPADERNPKESR